ncbi:MAG: Hsp20/alpha crystallin family protein [Pseudomonadota bacterium]
MARDLIGIMWADAVDRLDRAERVERSMFRPGRRAATACWEPPVDLFETETALWIVVALPGISTDQLEVRIERDMFIVSGHRQLPLPQATGLIHRLELPHGRFERGIRLPAGSFELTRRDLKDGCLTLVLHKLPSKG